jgi:hypothetical protein
MRRAGNPAAMPVSTLPSAASQKTGEPKAGPQ